jgi:hypothetical protein
MGPIAHQFDERRRLSALFRAGQACSWREAARLVRELAVQVGRIHAEGRIHRAIGLAQAWFDADQRPRLADPAELHPLNVDGYDPESCPPELAQAGPLLLPSAREAVTATLATYGVTIDPRQIDLYQLGATFCRLLSGGTVRAYMFDPRVKARLAPTVCGLLDRMLGFDARGPFADAQALVEAFDAILAQEPEAAQHSTPSERTTRSMATAPGPAGGDRRTRLAVRPPERLGHYRIVAPLGRGGMGEVYRAHDESLHREVAVKVLPADLSRDEDFVHRFRAEAGAMGQLHHPHVVPVYFFGEEGGTYYFVMPLVEGESLAERLHRPPRLRIEETLDLAGQCLEGLQAAHQAGLIHRDIKPGNILLERATGRAMLVDFGLVRRLGPGAQFTASGMVMGTADYLAPEQARGGEVDHRADLYAMGVVLYQMLAGRLPFVADSPTTMMFQHAYEKPPPMEEVAADVPAPLAAIVARLMAKDPDQRYPNCAEVLADLEAFRAGREVLAPARHERAGQGEAGAKPTCSVTRRTAVGVGVALSVIGGGTALWLSTGGRKTADPPPSAKSTATPHAASAVFPGYVRGGFCAAFKGDLLLFRNGEPVANYAETPLAVGDVVAVRFRSPFLFRAFRLAFVSSDHRWVIPFRREHFRKVDGPLREITPAAVQRATVQLEAAQPDEYFRALWDNLHLPAHSSEWMWWGGRDEWQQFACRIEAGMFRPVAAGEVPATLRWREKEPGKSVGQPAPGQAAPAPAKRPANRAAPAGS